MRISDDSLAALRAAVLLLKQGFSAGDAARLTGLPLSDAKALARAVHH